MSNWIVLHTRRRAGYTLVIAIVFSLVGMATAASSTAQTSGPVPTVGEVVVDGYDCDSGVLSYHAWVTDLPYLDPSLENGALYYWFIATYEQGDEYSIPVGTFNPQEEIAPYTGNVYLSVTVPSTNPDGPAGAQVTSIFVQVSVTSGGWIGPVDTSETTFTPDCGGSNDDIVEAIIAILIEILQSVTG